MLVSLMSSCKAVQLAWPVTKQYFIFSLRHTCTPSKRSALHLVHVDPSNRRGYCNILNACPRQHRYKNTRSCTLYCKIMISPSHDMSAVRRHQTLPKISEIVSPLHSCAYATGCTENRRLLTEQALPLSEGSLSRQQVFGASYVLALADSTLCCCINWILQITAVLFCHER